MGEHACRSIAKQVNVELTKKAMKTCEACALSKARQKNLSRHYSTVSKTVKIRTKEDEELEINEMVSVDLAKLGIPKSKMDSDPNLKRPNWLLVHDRATGRTHSLFLETKADMVEPLCELFYKWKQEGKPVKRVRMDNAGENQKLEQRLKSSDWKMGDIKVEFTSRNTPQQNSRVEKGFETEMNRGRTMLIAANIPFCRRYLFASRALLTATKLNGLTVVEWKGVKKTRYEHWGEKVPDFVHRMVPWGWAGVVKTKLTHQAKLQDRGTVMMFVGYPDNHAGDCYQMYNAKTQRVIVTRDIIWLDRMFYSKEGKPDLEFEDDDIIVDENDEFELSESESEDESDTEVNDEGANKVGGM